MSKVKTSCYFQDRGVKLYHNNCLDLLPKVPDKSIDVIISDPPYPEINRAYGKMTEDEWFEMMKQVVKESKRILKPTGSAVFILQPNSKCVGTMRLWLWKFLVWVGEYWNLIQDIYWWNFTTPPTVHVQRTRGLTRPSVKYCVWLGDKNCYRNQDEILWTQSDSNYAKDRGDRALQYKPSGLSLRAGRMAGTADSRGGTTPFNLIPIANANSISSGSAKGHGAATPDKLCNWWVKYISPPKSIVLDPFSGSGSVGLAAIKLGRRYIGIEKERDYCQMAQERICEAMTVEEY